MKEKVLERMRINYFQVKKDINEEFSYDQEGDVNKELNKLEIKD